MYETVIIPYWQAVGNELEKRIGANPDFTNPQQREAGQRRVNEGFLSKELLTDVTHQVEDTVAESKLRITTVIEKLFQLANEIEEILQDKDLTLKQTFEKACVTESKFDVATIRAFKAVLATTFFCYGRVTCP